MPTFTQEEINLIFIYNGGVREWLIDDLKNMVSWLSDDETELRDLADGVIVETPLDSSEYKGVSRLSNPNSPVFLDFVVAADYLKYILEMGVVLREYDIF